MLDDFEGEELGGEAEEFYGEYIGERNLVLERHGLGYANLPNGDMYAGHYRQGRRHGFGLYVFKNGARYAGQYRCGMRRGRGRFFYPDGSRYDGEWRHDEKHGHGVYVYANGDRYEGAWVRGQRHGLGTYTHAAAEVRVRGTWQRGQLDGPCELVLPGADAHRVHYAHWLGDAPVEGNVVHTWACQLMAVGYLVNVGDMGDAAAAAAAPELEWRQRYIAKYDRSRLPPEPMPLPQPDDEESDVCPPTPASSEEALEYDVEEGEAEECEGDCMEDDVVGENVCDEDTITDLPILVKK